MEVSLLWEEEGMNMEVSLLLEEGKMEMRLQYCGRRRG
jgi:hypothetical protein